MESKLLLDQPATFTTRGKVEHVVKGTQKLLRERTSTPPAEDQRCSNQ